MRSDVGRLIGVRKILAQMGRDGAVRPLQSLSLLCKFCLPFVEDALDLGNPFGCADEVVLDGSVGESDEVLFFVVGRDGDVRHGPWGCLVKNLVQARVTPVELPAVVAVRP